MKCTVLKKCYRNGRLYVKGDAIDLPSDTKLGSVFKVFVDPKAPAPKAGATSPASPKGNDI